MTGRIILALVMLAFAGSYLAWRLIGTGKGAHAAPRWYTADDDVATAVLGTVRRQSWLSDETIPRPPTEHAPPWDYQAAPVIEPAAVTSGPPEPEPEDLGIWLAAGTYSRATGQVRDVRVELLPPVAELLGYASTQAAVDAIFSQGHSVDSIFTKADARLVRELTDGRS